MSERRLRLKNGKVWVDFLSKTEKKKLKKFLKREARVFSSERGFFISPIGTHSRPIESIALDVGEELNLPLDVPPGTSFSECFAPQNWPSVPASARSARI